MAIDRYDPKNAPDPEEWQALDEAARIALVSGHHAAAGLGGPNARAHAILHVMVENQIAMGAETPVKEKARQLMAQGLNRHDTIHAIAGTLMGVMQGAMRRGEEPAGDVNAQYYAALKRLNARKWLKSG